MPLRGAIAAQGAREHGAYDVIKIFTDCGITRFSRHNQCDHIKRLLNVRHSSWKNIFEFVGTVWCTKHIFTAPGVIANMVCLNATLWAFGCVQDSKIYIFDTATRTIQKTFNHEKEVTTLATLSHRVLVSASHDNCAIKVWDVVSGTCVPMVKKDMVSSLAVIGDTTVASGSYSNDMNLWDINSGKRLKVFSCLSRDGHHDWVRSLVSLSPTTFASGSDDKTIKIWDINKTKCLKTLKGHNDDVEALSVFQNGVLVSACVDSSLRFWDVPSGKCIKWLKCDRISNDNICHRRTSLAILSDNILVSANTFTNGATFIQLWDIQGDCIQRFYESGIGTQGVSLCALSGGGFVYSVGNDLKIGKNVIDVAWRDVQYPALHVLLEAPAPSMVVHVVSSEQSKKRCRGLCAIL